MRDCGIGADAPRGFPDRGCRPGSVGIFEYIAEHDSPAKARLVLDRVEAIIDGLAEFPERGDYPKELVRVGIRDYRETHFKPYRIIYRMLGDDVFVYLVADGRREMQSLLIRRLL